MKIILTSTGTKDPAVGQYILDSLGEPTKTKLLLIQTATNVIEDVAFAIKEKKRLYELGFDITEFDLAEKTPKETGKALDEADTIFVTGGQPYYLLKEMRNSGFADLAKEKLTNKVYIGASAGSYVVCPNIEMGSWKREKRKFDLTDLTALGLVDFMVFAHYEEKYETLLEEKKKTAEYEVFGISDTQAISVVGGKREFINF